MAGKVYCTARHQMHACLFTWQVPGHPGDGTDHECHCGLTWIDRRYQDGTKPQLAWIVADGSWTFSISLYKTLETGVVIGIWFGRRGLHLPLRWSRWRS